MPLSAGDKLGSYEILSPIGAGGMGEVYRARDAKLNRDVAIKVLPPSLAHDADFVARFRREAQMLASLNHVNIAAIYGLEGNAIVMELVEGQPPKGPMPLGEALHVARQIAEALEAAHEKGIIHRDLKPGNIIVTPEGVAKVLDFGLAKAVETGPAVATGPNSPTLTMRATEAGVILGTAGYMSPEQAAGKVVDRRADIWSFGVVLWELLTGSRLFHGETVADTLADVMRAEIDFTRIPEGPVRELVRRCLDRNLRNRLQHIGEARHILDAPSPVVPKTRLGLLPWVALTVGLCGGIVIGLWQAPTPELPVRRFSVKTQFHQFSAYVRRAAISPNGKYLAYTDGGRLWIRDLDKEDARPLDGTDGALGPFFSPDSEFVGFGTDRDLKKILVRGGKPVSLCPLAFYRGATWSPDGLLIAFSVFGSGLLAVPAGGGTPKTVLIPEKVEEGLTFFNPYFLPKESGSRTLVVGAGSISEQKLMAVNLETGQRVLFGTGAFPVYSSTGHIIYQAGPTRSGLWALPFSPKTMKATGEAFPVAVDAVEPDLTAAGILVSVDSPRSSLQQLVWRDRYGKKLGTIGQPQQMFSPALSPDGSQVAGAGIDAGNRDIWTHEVARPLKTRLTFGPSANGYPKWSPSGKEIAFATDRNGNFDIFQQAASGGGEAKPLVASPQPEYPQDWSADGRFLVYVVQDSKTGFDIWYLRRNLGGSFDSVPFLRTPFMELGGRLSPDGRFLAYGSNESGGNEVYVRPFPEGTGKWQVSANGGDSPRWSTDGKELYYIKGDALMAVPVAATGGFSKGVESLLFRSADFASVEPAILQPYDVSRDGRFVIVERIEDANVKPPSIHLVENWFAEFNERTKP